jgi:hypothetical protein
MPVIGQSHMAQTHPKRGVSAILVLFVLSFGLLTGGMLLIEISIVGFWKSLTPSEFVSWFASHSSRLGVIMVPLGMITLLLSLAAVAVSWRSRSRQRQWAMIAALCALCVMVSYPVFFAGANARFIAGGLSARPSVNYSINGRYGTGAVRFSAWSALWLQPWHCSCRPLNVPIRLPTIYI